MAQERKVVMLGATSVGKTTILKQFTEGKFVSNLERTIGAQYGSITISVGNQRYKLKFWDVAGQERYLSLAPMYFRGADLILLVWDRNKDTDLGPRDTLEALKNYYLQGAIAANTPVIFVLNKIDTEDTLTPITKQEHQKIQEIAEYHNLQPTQWLIAEVSAKTGAGIELLKITMGRELAQTKKNVVAPLDVAGGTHKLHSRPSYGFFKHPVTHIVSGGVGFGVGGAMATVGLCKPLASWLFLQLFATSIVPPAVVIALITGGLILGILGGLLAINGIKNTVQQCRLNRTSAYQTI